MLSLKDLSQVDLKVTHTVSKKEVTQWPSQWT